MSADEKPGPRLVSSNPAPGTDRVRDTEIAKRRLSWELKELAANLMRVTRGAGKPYEIGAQAAAIVRSFEEYRNIAGVYPNSGELADMLVVERDDDRFLGCDEDELKMMFAERGMVRGALQIAASELLGQRTQAARGETELLEAVRNHAKASESFRRRVAKECR